jgi:hypothetical protein
VILGVNMANKKSCPFLLTKFVSENFAFRKLSKKRKEKEKSTFKVDVIKRQISRSFFGDKILL